MVDAVCKSKPIQAQTLADLLSPPNLYGTCTSGDPDLDVALGGGFRTGMIWEVVGERFVYIYYSPSNLALNHTVVRQERPS